jgi:hypothetical protein
VCEVLDVFDRVHTASMINQPIPMQTATGSDKNAKYRWQNKQIKVQKCPDHCASAAKDKRVMDTQGRTSTWINTENISNRYLPPPKSQKRTLLMTTLEKVSAKNSALRDGDVHECTVLLTK